MEHCQRSTDSGSTNGSDPAQAAHQALMQNKTFKKVTGGIHHRSFEESYGQYADHAAMFTPENQGVDSSQQVDSVGDPTPDPQLMNTPLDQDLSVGRILNCMNRVGIRISTLAAKRAIRRRVAAGQRVKKALQDLYGFSPEEAQWGMG